MATTGLRGVRIDTDGTRTDITSPAGTDPSAWLRKELGGWPEHAYYGHGDLAVTAVVHESGMSDGLPVNGAATTFVCLIRNDQLGYYLYGPVYFFGLDRTRGALVTLAGQERELLDRQPVYGKDGGR